MTDQPQHPTSDPYRRIRFQCSSYPSSSGLQPGEQRSVDVRVRALESMKRRSAWCRLLYSGGMPAVLVSLTLPSEWLTSRKRGATLRHVAGANPIRTE